MEKKEKVEFILEQMRLCLAKKDYMRTQIISKKVTTKYFEEKDTHVCVSVCVSVCVCVLATLSLLSLILIYTAWTLLSCNMLLGIIM